MKIISKSVRTLCQFDIIDLFTGLAVYVDKSSMFQRVMTITSFTLNHAPSLSLKIFNQLFKHIKPLMRFPTIRKYGT